MDNKKPKAKKDVQSKSTSISIGGDIAGNIVVGDRNVIGYTSEKVAELLAQINKTFQPKSFDGRCPYKGLDVFEEEDADLFFGREKLVKELVGKVKESRTVFITGPSGSGKSSLVRAGLLPALKQGVIKNSDKWLYESIKPGRNPFEALAFAFSRLKSPELGKYFSQNINQPNVLNECADSALSEKQDQRLLLFIDQFEEVFTQLSKDVTEAFVRLLTNAITNQNSRVIILFCMRSDFIPNCATYPELNTLLNQQFIQIGAMQAEELVSAIAQPALRVGLRIDPDLIAQIINDMKGEPGALPLMQFALKDLFDDGQSKGGVIALTLNAYLGHGGIQKSLERHADAAFGKLEKHEQELARNIFSGLIEIGRGTQDTRRTALFEELIPANTNENEVEAIVQKLADARLVTTDEQAGKDTITISHEKLIDAWPWLKKLVNENREVIALQNEITSDAKEWEEQKRDTSYLYTGARLLNADEQVKKQNLNLNQLAKEFVKAGQTRKRRSQGLIFSGISIIVIVSIIASVLFRSQSQENLELAEEALARQLAAQAESLFSTGNSKQMTAVLLAVQSMKIAATKEAAQILQINTLAIPIARVIYESNISSVSFSPDGLYAVAAGCENNKLEEDKNICIQSSIRVWDIATGEIIIQKSVSGSIYSVIFSPNGRYLAWGGSDNSLRVIQVDTNQEITKVIDNNDMFSIAFSPDSHFIASAGCNQYRDGFCETGIVKVWDIQTGQAIFHIIHEGGYVDSIIFSSDGKYLVSTGGYPDSTVQVWDINAEKELSHFVHEGGGITAVAISPNGQFAVSASRFDEMVRVWEIQTGKQITGIVHTDSVYTVSFSPDGKYIVSGGSDRIARVWDAFTGEEYSRMYFDSLVSTSTFDPSGQYIAAGSYDGTVRIWDMNTSKEFSRLSHESFISSIEFSPNGRYIISAGCENRNENNDCIAGSAIIWNVGSALGSNSPIGMQNNLINHGWGVNSISFSPNGDYLISGDNDKTAKVWDTHSWLEIANMTHDSSVSLVSFNLDGTLGITATEDDLHVWDVKDWQEIHHFTFDDSKSVIGLSPDKNYIILIKSNNIVQILSITDGKEIIQLIHDDRVISVALSEDNQYVVTGNTDNTIRIWRISDGKEITRISYKDSIKSVSFSRNGHYIMSSGCRRTDIIGNCEESIIHFWNAKTGNQISQLSLNGSVSFTKFGPNEKYVVSLGSQDTKIVVWNPISGEEFASIPIENIVLSVEFSPEGNHIIVAGCGQRKDTIFAEICTSGIVQVWNILDGQEVISIPQTSTASSTSFSPDGRYLVTGNYDGTIQIIPYLREDLISQACSRVTRNLTRAEWQKYIGDVLPYQAVCENLPLEPEPTP